MGFIHRDLEGRGNLEECLGDEGWRKIGKVIGGYLYKLCTNSRFEINCNNFLNEG